MQRAVARRPAQLQYGFSMSTYIYLHLDTDTELKAAMTFRQIHPMLLYIAQCVKYTQNTQ